MDIFVPSILVAGIGVFLLIVGAGLYKFQTPPAGSFFSYRTKRIWRGVIIFSIGVVLVFGGLYDFIRTVFSQLMGF